MSRQPWSKVTPGSRGLRGGSWRPPETDEERELREAYVTPKRARAIREEIEREPNPRAVISEPGCPLCGIAPDARCFLPAARCARARA